MISPLFTAVLTLAAKILIQILIIYKKANTVFTLKSGFFIENSKKHLYPTECARL